MSIPRETGGRGLLGDRSLVSRPVGIEALALAVLNALRPAAFASVYALLASPRPVRPLAAYAVAGLASSLVAGVIVVVALHGVRVETGTSTANAIIELAGGFAALGFAAGIASGRLRNPSRPRPESTGDSRIARRLRDPSLRVAASAGVATHLPGLFYLLGLNAIAGGDPGLLRGIVAVVVFDLIWLTIPIAALIFSVRRPETARRAIGQVSDWLRRHEQVVLTLAFTLVGAYFAGRGFVDLLG